MKGTEQDIVASEMILHATRGAYPSLVNGTEQIEKELTTRRRKEPGENGTIPTVHAASSSENL